MRGTAFYSSFTVMCLISAALFGFIEIDMISPLSILYFGIASCFGAFIYSFFSGFFITGVSKWSLKKYNAQKSIKQINDKESTETLRHELEIDDCEDKIYIYYYWFYVLTLFVLIACWALSINFMQRPAR
jgi:hypothetical protein